MVYFFFQTKNLNSNVYLKEKMCIEEMVSWYHGLKGMKEISVEVFCALT